MRIFGKTSVDKIAEAIAEWRVLRQVEAERIHNEMIELRAQMAVQEDKLRPMLASMELAWEKVDKAIKRLNYREQAAQLRADAEQAPDDTEPPHLSPIEALRARRARRK